jgi:1-acyl-sn-glycerol-3-phosphate acyltransferase
MPRRACVDLVDPQWQQPGRSTRECGGVLRVLSVVFWVFFAVTSVVFIVGAALIWLVTVAFDRRRLVLLLYAAAWGHFYILMNPMWTIRVRGRDRLPWDGPAILVANHASIIDILAVQAVYRPFRWVSKYELFRLPIVGWYLRLSGGVPVKRNDGDSVREMMRSCNRLLEAGLALALFPEGTRTRDGSLRPFKSGAFDLAAKHGVPVYPLAIRGTRRALPARGLILIERADIVVEVLPPLFPGDFADSQELRDATRRVISESLSAGT